MVFANFIKHAKFKFNHHNLQFFQTTYRQFNLYNELTEYYQLWNTKWYSNHKYAKSKLAISNGHYGLYYTMYNHDEKQQKAQISIDSQLLLQYLVTSSPLLLLLSNYLINYYINLIPKFDLKFDFKDDLAYYHGKVKQTMNFKRCFLTCCPRSKKLGRIEEPLKREKEEIKIEEVKEVQQRLDNVDKIEQVEVQQVTVEKSTPIDLSQDEDFLSNQITLIETLYSQDQYLSIYPIYQTIKRNGLKIANIDTYNLILQSIVSRKFTQLNDLSLNDLLEIYEIKLTDLLTVYQDLLNNNIKPNLSTYNLIIENLLISSLNISNLNSSSNGLLYYQSSGKCQNFAQIGLDVFNSIQNFADLNLSSILPLIIKNLINHPNLINQDILMKLIKLFQDSQFQQSLLHYENHESSIDSVLSFISLTKSFNKFPQLFADSKSRYQFIVSIYDFYKQLYLINNLENTDEFKIYSPLIESLIYNNHTNLASKFLDDILIDYKKSITSTNKPSKLQISLIISTYIISIANQGPETSIRHQDKQTSLHNAYNLLMKFNKIQYLPELSIELYNDLINKFVVNYYELSNDKSKLAMSDSNKLNTIFNQQVSILEKCWILYDHLAIRNDYQIINASSKITCRQSLLSLSIELGDHEHIFQLIKEVLLSKHLIFDIQVFKKLLSYLYNGVVSESGFNFQYYGLIWNLVDSQLIHYKFDNSSNFISEMINYLIISPTPALIEINCQQLMNSRLVDNVIDNFDFQKDNLYGISIISRFLMQYNGNNPELINRIVNYQAKLINRFEDTENHYFELNPELLNLKDILKPYFSSMIQVHQNIVLFTTDVLHACKNFDVPVPEKVIVDPKTLDFQYEIDLSYLLNIEYNSGTSEFISLFNNNMNFNQSTWEIIINHNFVHDYMLELKFPIGEFIRRLFDAKFDMSSKIELLHTLVKFDYETINISVLKFLEKNPSVFISYPAQSIIELIETVDGTQNKYLKLVFYRDSGAFFNNAYEHNKDLAWVSKYFEFLAKENQPQLIIDLITQHRIVEVDTSVGISGAKFKVLVSYLWSLGATNNPDFISVFKNNILANKHNQDYLKSRPLVEVLLQYYLSRDDMKSIDIILAKFTPLYGKSQKINERLLYASFVKSMNAIDYNCPFPMTKAATVDELSIRLIGSSDFSEMKQIIGLNSSMIRDHLEAVVSSIFKHLTDASKSQLANKHQLSEKFSSLIKAFKLMGVKELSIMNLSDIIKYLTINDCKDILNIIILKLINGDKFTNVLNFYFMETKFNDDKDKSKVLNLLYNACNYVNDKINTFNIITFSRVNNIQLKLD